MPWKMSSSTVKMSSSTHLMSGFAPTLVATARVFVRLASRIWQSLSMRSIIRR